MNAFLGEEVLEGDEISECKRFRFVALRPQLDGRLASL